MLRCLALLFSLFLLAPSPRAEEIPYSVVLGIVPQANGYWTVLTTRPAPVSTVTTTLAFIHPVPERNVLWIGDAGGAVRQPGGMQGSGVVYSLGPLRPILGPRASTTPPGDYYLGPASTIETEWTSTDGARQKVITPCFSFGNPAACAAAHLEMVNAMKALFPVRQ